MQFVSKLTSFPLKLFISVACIDISSMALTSFAAFSPDAPTTDVDYVVAGKAVASGAVGAKDAANVDGTDVDTVGITCVEEVATYASFNWIKSSKSFSVSFS